MLSLFRAAPVTFILVCVGLLAAGVGVIIAVATKGRWKDRGMMKTKGGKSYFWRDAKTRKLRMAITEDVPKQLTSEILSWVHYIENAIVGDELFSTYIMRSPDEIVIDIHILVTMGDSGQNPFTRHQVNETTGEILTATITFPADLKLEDYPNVVRHEGGHALGLDHDESTASAMHPKLRSRSSFYTDADRELLKRTFS